MDAKYRALVHAMQSGVAMEIEKEGLAGAAADPKHLRVGVNVAIVESSALWKLLLDKGIVTEDEMRDRLHEAHADEVARYEQHLSRLLGCEIKLA